MKFINDFLIEGIHCLMANPEDIKEWSYKINLLIDNREIANIMVENAFRLYKNNYTWDKRAEIINDFFKL